MKQIKMLLLTSIIILFTGCGGSSGSGSTGGSTEASGESSVVTTPEGILKQALQAQANGDIDGFLSMCALKGQSEEDINETRSLLESIDKQITFSNFSFELVFHFQWVRWNK